MCRLYGFRATEPTKVECTLVHAQNALMIQSREDLTGYSHAHGWGVATYEDHQPHVEKEAWAAYHGEHFHRTAARIHSKTVLAHVRRATVGGTSRENTHPFFHEKLTFAHNGTVPNFDRIREALRAAISSRHLEAINGETDSEHVFRYIMTLRDRQSEKPLRDILIAGVRQIVGWCRAIEADAKIGLNLLLTDGERIVGTRWARSLYSIEREGVYDCEICGFPHIHHDPNRDYRAVVVASEPITHEAWQEIPEHSVFEISPTVDLDVEPLILNEAGR